MVVQRFVYRQARGLSSDTTPLVPEYRYTETDTGRQKYHNGLGYQTLRAFDKPEVLKNKTIDINRNTILSLAHSAPPFATNNKRTGAIIPAATAKGSLQGAFKPLRAINGVGPSFIYPQIASSNEGLCMVFETDFSSSGGYDSSAAANILFETTVTRREFNPYFVFRAKIDATDSTRLYIGYNSLAAGAIPLSDTVIGNTHSGVILGFNLATINFSAFHNSGAGAMSTTAFSGFPKDGAFHTYEIIMTASNIVCKIDGDAHVVTLTTNIPALTTDLRLFVLCQVQF